MPRLNPATRAALDAAIEQDHPCDDYGCDIAVARKHGFIEASAHLLMGATETPAVNAVVARYSLVIPDVHSKPFDRWAAFHREYGRECPSCESFMYADPDEEFEPYSCTNCGAQLYADRFELAIHGDVHYEAAVRDWVAVPIEEGDEYVLSYDGEPVAIVTREDTEPRTYRITEPVMPDDEASGWLDSRTALRHAAEAAAISTYPEPWVAQAAEVIG